MSCEPGDTLRSVLPTGVLLAYLVATQAEWCTITAHCECGPESCVAPLNAGVSVNLYLDLLAGVQWALSQRRALGLGCAVSVSHLNQNWGVLQDFLGDLCLDSYVAPAESQVFFRTRFMNDFTLEHVSGPELLLTELGPFFPPNVEGVKGVNDHRQVTYMSSGGYFGPALDLSTLSARQRSRS